MVIINTAYNNPDVKGLVHITAFAPNQGQSLGNSLMSQSCQKIYWLLIAEDLLT